MLKKINTYYLISFLGILSCKPPSSIDYVKVRGYKNIVEKYDAENKLFITINKSAIPKSILSFGNKSNFYLYILRDAESKWARIVFNYNGLDQLLFEKITIIKNRSKKIEWIFNNKNMSDNNRPGGVVQEEKDIQLTDIQLNDLKTLFVPRAKVQYEFSSGKIIEYELTKDQVENAQKLIEYYESLSLNIIR
tara:strand:- start:368 stop:943 length:576 start_codon:yes stop_codon:yes gene_type:complete